MIALWTGFLVCTAVIVYSGTQLSKYGDIIAEKTGLGSSWIGVVLMASVTSLPELITGISSVTYADVPNIAIGDILGSCVFNMLILALLDAFYPLMPISAKAHRGHVLSAAFGILLLTIAGLSISLAKDVFHFYGVGAYSLLFVVIYFIAMRMIYSFERRQMAQLAVELEYENITTRTTVWRFAANAAVVIAAAIFLPKVGEGIAESTGLGQTFVGNAFIALSTSLPEVVISIAAVRRGSVDLAIGNLFGSNIFNMFILAIDDVFFRKGPILSFTDSTHIISAFSALAMTAIAIIGLTYRAEKKRLYLAWDSICIVGVFIGNIMLLLMLK